MATRGRILKYLAAALLAAFCLAFARTDTTQKSMVRAVLLEPGEWKREKIISPKTNREPPPQQFNFYRMEIRNEGNSPVWIDAVQLEHGTVEAGTFMEHRNSTAEVYLSPAVSPERYSGIGVLTFDHPLDQRFAHLEYNFDCIGFRSQDLLEWAEYYITNRPMMKKRTPIHTLIEVRLVENGSIRMKS